MINCIKCKKSVTKRSPGLECNKCGMLVHAKAECAGLTNKQLTAVRATENLEWTCTTCTNSHSFRKSSFIIPTDDEDEDCTEEIGKDLTLDSKKFMAQLTKEMEKILKKELEETNRSMQFLSDKLEDCLESIEVFKEKIKGLENKNYDLINKNKFLENKVGAMEQRIMDIEQSRLSRKLELAGVPELEDENVLEMVNNTATKLNMNAHDVQTVTRVRAGKTSVICLDMKTDNSKIKWLAAAKCTPMIASDISNIKDPLIKTNKVFIREALTPFIKTLLWKTKQELRDTYKYIWCKNGKIFARKNDKSEFLIIRSESDIFKLKNTSSIIL